MRRALFARLSDPEWLAGLRLPTREEIPEGQGVALADGKFTRPDRAALAAQYRARPRTWIFERASHTVPWLSLTAADLGTLSESRLEVLAAVFGSRAADHAPGDVLLIPENLAYATATPADPGHSRHLAIGLCRHTEYTKATPNQPTQQQRTACASFENDPRRPGECKKCGYAASEH
jgi:hypothetical protein